MAKAKTQLAIVGTSSGELSESRGYLVLYRYHSHWHTYLDKSGKQVLESRAKAESVKLKLDEVLAKDGLKGFAVKVVELPA